MRWMIGLDLDTRSRGALELAGWLAARTRKPATQEFVAVHVLDERLHHLLRTDQLEDLFSRAGQELAGAVDASTAAPSVVTRRIVSAETPERGLIDTLATDACDGLVIGRIAEGTPAPRVVRLGRVARRLLRRLPRPVVVAPPDLASASLGKGPLLLATDLDESSKPAAAFAVRLAAELGRDVTLVHVDTNYTVVPTFWGDPVVVQTPPRRIPADVDDWAKSVGLGAARTILAEGRIVENVLDIAKREDAPLIVCGSRGLNAFDRVFISSTASDLARLADRPVAVVPSH